MLPPPVVKNAVFLSVLFKRHKESEPTRGLCCNRVNIVRVTGITAGC